MIRLGRLSLVLLVLRPAESRNEFAIGLIKWAWLALSGALKLDDDEDDDDDEGKEEEWSVKLLLAHSPTRLL